MHTEKHIRKTIIDQRLKAAGWDVANKLQLVEEPLHEYQGQRFCDYILLGKDGTTLAIVEAKKTSKGPELGCEQAKQYCTGLQEKLGIELPFCFYTNGHEIYFLKE